MAHSVEKTSANPTCWNSEPHATCPDCGEPYATIKVGVPGVSYVLCHCCAASSSMSPASGWPAKQPHH